MSSALEHASFYKRAVETFGLAPERAEKVAAQMAQLGVGKDDAYLLLFLATGRIEDLSETIPANMERVGRQTAKAVRKSVDEALDDMPSRLEGQFERHMGSLATSLTDTTSAAIDREARRRDRTYMGGFALAVALLLILASGGTYQMGRNAMSADAAQWSALVNLADGARWLNLARLNPDLDRVLAQGCTVGEGRVVSGARICDLPLAVTAPIATSEGANAVRLSIAEWANRLGVWGLLGVGALFGWIGNAIARKLAR